MVLNGRHSLGSSSLVPLAATVSATSATSPSTTTCGSKSLRHFWCGDLRGGMCAFLICACFHCTDFPPLFDPCGLNSDVSSNPVRRPPAVYLLGGKRYRLSLVILHRYPCLDTQRPACTALPGRLNPPLPLTAPLTPRELLPTTAFSAYGLGLEPCLRCCCSLLEFLSSSLRLLGSAAV